MIELNDSNAEMTDRGLEFTANDDAGNPVSGVITLDKNHIAAVTITETTCDNLKNGNIYYYIEYSGTTYIRLPDGTIIK